jgi:hypothetical protein
MSHQIKLELKKISLEKFVALSKEHFEDTIGVGHSEECLRAASLFFYCNPPTFSTPYDLSNAINNLRVVRNVHIFGEKTISKSRRSFERLVSRRKQKELVSKITNSAANEKKFQLVEYGHEYFGPSDSILVDWSTSIGKVLKLKIARRNVYNYPLAYKLPSNYFTSIFAISLRESHLL